MSDIKTLYHHIPRPHKPINIAVLHKQEQQEAGFNTRLAVLITKGFGSIWAFYVLIAWMFIWMALATLGVWAFANDHYPFSFLLFLSNLVQLWALPVLAVGQGVLGRKQELQSNEQYQYTMSTYHDSEQMILHLGEQDAELLKQTAELLKQTPLLEEILEIVKYRSQAVALTSAASYEPDVQSKSAAQKGKAKA